MRTVLQVAGVILLTSVLAAQQTPAYVGKWKLNTAKSDFGQLTATYEAVPGGGYKATMDGLSYTFTLDGKEVQTPWGTMQSGKAINATTWEFTNKVKGQLFATDIVRLSPDGKTMTVESRVVQPAGGTATNTMTFTRVAGTSGLAGTWRAAKMASTTAGLLEIAVKGTDGVVLRFVDQTATCDGRFDGKPHPAVGPTFPAGWTCTFSKNTANGFHVVFSKDGKPMYSSTISVSADGKTLTDDGGSVNTKERTKAVYEKQ